MAYKDILPSTNLSAVDIRDTLGCSSNNTALYCVGDTSGGYAFYVVENGGSPSDGYLIGTPYFNIYSNEAPGEWLRDGTGVIYKLKRNSYGDIVVGSNTFTSTSYCYDLGTFAGYRHTSIAPYYSSNTFKATLISSENYTIWIGNIYPGTYDWAKLVPDIDREDLYYSISVSNSTSGAEVDIPYTVGETMIQIDDVSGGVSIFYEGYPPASSANYTMKLGLYKTHGDSFILQFYLPIESSSSGNSGSTTGISTTLELDTESGWTQPYVGNVLLTSTSNTSTNPYYQTLTSLDWGYTVGYSTGTFKGYIEMETLDTSYTGAYYTYQGTTYSATSVSVKYLGDSNGMNVYQFTGSVTFADNVEGAVTMYIY